MNKGCWKSQTDHLWSHINDFLLELFLQNQVDTVEKSVNGGDIQWRSIRYAIWKLMKKQPNGHLTIKVRHIISALPGAKHPLIRILRNTCMVIITIIMSITGITKPLQFA